jgi:hypothetical protein
VSWDKLPSAAPAPTKSARRGATSWIPVAGRWHSWRHACSRPGFSLHASILRDPVGFSLRHAGRMDGESNILDRTRLRGARDARSSRRHALSLRVEYLWHTRSRATGGGCYVADNLGLGGPSYHPWLWIRLPLQVGCRRGQFGSMTT